jgi:hypothetical protein
MKSRKSQHNAGDKVNNWILLAKDINQAAHWIAQCLVCNHTETQKLSILRSKACSCQKSTTIGEHVGTWKIIAKASNPAHWEAECTLCGNKKIKRKHEFKRYVCICQGYLKRTQNNLQKYGVENPRTLPEIQQKAKNTMKERYGYEHALQNPSIKARAKTTNLARYGVDNPMQSSSVRSKVDQTNIEKYGTKTTFESPLVKEKIKASLQEKYGVDSPLKSTEVYAKFKQTMLEKYNVEHYKQLPSERNRLNEWCEENAEKLFTSKGEQELLDWVRTYYPSAKKHKQEGHEIDIFIPELKLGIEFNGLYWHSEAGLKRKQHNARLYHLTKTKYFEEKGIRLMHIWDHEWYNHTNQVKSFLLSALNKNTIKLNPRNCKIIWSDSKQEIERAHKLLDDYHIQGHTNSTKYVVNVYYQEELIATATFGKHHRNARDWILSRFCAKTNYVIRGLLGKISKLAYTQLQEPLISWADYRLSQGNGYKKAGWKFEELLGPDYFYHKNGRVVSKQSRQKKVVNTPQEMTEYEHAKLDGLERVWDCGKIRFVYKP